MKYEIEPNGHIRINDDDNSTGELYICIIRHIISVCIQLRLLASMVMPMRIIRLL